MDSYISLCFLGSSLRSPKCKAVQYLFGCLRKKAHKAELSNLCTKMCKAKSKQLYNSADLARR